MSVKTVLHELVDLLDDEQAAEAMTYIHQLSKEREDSASPESADEALSRRMGPRVISGRDFMTQPPRTWQDIVAEQGSHRIERFEDILGSGGPEDETADDMIAAIRVWRREGGHA